MLRVPEKFRVLSGPLGSRKEDGPNGVFMVPIAKDVVAQCIVSNGFGWEHVSVTINEEHAIPRRVKKVATNRTPTWEEMCKMKAFFWHPGDSVVQYHPAENQYVNVHPNVLHLWRPVNQQFPKPPMYLV